jgi:hypothetical protein
MGLEKSWRQPAKIPIPGFCCCVHPQFVLRSFDMSTDMAHLVGEAILGAIGQKRRTWFVKRRK